MPYVSDAQRRFFHSAGAKQAGISPSTVKEFDKASKGKDLPEHYHKTKKKSVMHRLADEAMKRAYK
jgi:hypothetical protein